jgi:hypothetical protein
VGLGPFLRDLVPHYWRWETDPRALLGYGQQTVTGFGWSRYRLPEVGCAAGTHRRGERSTRPWNRPQPTSGDGPPVSNLIREKCGRGFTPTAARYRSGTCGLCTARKRELPAQALCKVSDMHFLQVVPRWLGV